MKKHRTKTSLRQTEEKRNSQLQRLMQVTVFTVHVQRNQVPVFNQVTVNPRVPAAEDWSDSSAWRLVLFIVDRDTGENVWWSWSVWAECDLQTEAELLPEQLSGKRQQFTQIHATVSSAVMSIHQELVGTKQVPLQQFLSDVDLGAVWDGRVLPTWVNLRSVKGRGEGWEHTVEGIIWHTQHRATKH